MNNTLSPQRVYAINQFKGVLDVLSKQGLLDVLKYNYGVVHPEMGELSSLHHKELVQAILVKEYGAADVEAFNA